MNALALSLAVAGLVVSAPLAVVSTAEAQGAQRWISEELEVDTRTGRTLQNRIVRMARSGEAVTVLEETDGYSKIRYSNGTEAWILSRFLQNRPHSRERLERVEAELAEIRGGSDTQESRIAELLDVRSTLEAERDALQQELSTQTEELEELRRVAARPAELQRQNVDLRQSLNATENELADLRREVEVSGADSQRKWFTLGSLVVLGSLILGVILARLPARRRRDAW